MIYDSIDMVLSLDGDLVLSEHGDIMTTEFDVLVAIIQAIQIRIRYPAFSWELYPDLGVVELPIGQENSEETAEAWEEAIYTALVKDGLVDSGNLRLTSAPLNEHTIITLISLTVHPTDANGGRTGLNIYAIMDYNKNIARFY
jgi:hypothetical protein